MPEAALPNVIQPPGWGALAALVLVIALSGYLGYVAQVAISKGSFLKGFFLGNRGLGVWTMALTATVQSGGTFMGFPSLVYTHGWAVALWIGSYMIVPLTGFAVLGKRLAQVSRRTGAITVPDLFRGRFDSPALGLTTSLLIMFFLTFMLVAQFKAGAIVMKLSWPGSTSLALSEELPSASADEANKSVRETNEGKLVEAKAKKPIDWQYLIGLGVFTITVVGYTLFGGFLASVWTDLFQSVLMFIGVIVLLVLALQVVGLEKATLIAIEKTGPGIASLPGYARDGRQFMPLGLACSFFFVWIFGGMASPASIVRVMAAKDTGTLRRSIFVLSAYNLFIYPPLIVICICARAIMPDLKVSDEVIPRMALLLTQELPLGSFIAGLILAAPFGAVMATVSSYLVVIASGIVRDVYQRFVHHDANDEQIRRITTVVMVVLGIVAIVANIEPVQYLQALVIFCTSSGAASFLVPALMTAYWRRATAPGALAAMLTGATTVLVLFIIGLQGSDPMIGVAAKFRPHFLLGLEPVVWGIAASLLVGVTVSLCTPPPRPELVAKMFDD